MSVEDNKVGFAKPPKHSQFKKGQSGNPKGRPKSRGAIELDLDRILDQHVAVQSADGAEKRDSREVELLVQVKKALKGDLRAAKYVLDQFQKYGAISAPEAMAVHGVVRLPTNDLPWKLCRMLFEKHGAPPWKPHQINAMKKQYMKTRSANERLEDEKRGYE